jgi:dTDP-4-dehydrorhamnose reductase
LNLKHKLPVVLVTGSNGQLGRCLQQLAPSVPQYHFIFTTHAQLPIEDRDAVNRFFASEPVTWCINCAAYTAVDRAETEPSTAMLINGTAAGFLAAACHINGAGFVQVSTDYVFDGRANRPYLPTDPVNPINVYGASKLLGEQLAMVEHPDCIIVRTSWVYAPFGHNFVKTMLRLMGERASINVVNDQLGRPTYAMDLAAALLHIITSTNDDTDNKTPGGIYHFSNGGKAISWYDFAEAIQGIVQSPCMVNAIPTSGYPTPAQRPAYSVLDTTTIEDRFGLAIPYWDEALQRCLAVTA